MAVKYTGLALFNVSDGFTPAQVNKLNQNFRSVDSKAGGGAPTYIYNGSTGGGTHVEVGNTYSLPPGEEARVVDSDNGDDVRLDFYIPSAREYGNATQSADGLMSKEDKAKLDSMEGGGQSQGGTVPVGAIMPYGGTVPPDGWFLCDGSEVSREVFGDLFAVIGETYGFGDGSTTFNLPDLRGRVPVGPMPAATAQDTPNLLVTDRCYHQDDRYDSIRIDLVENLAVNTWYTLTLWDVEVSHAGKASREALTVSAYLGGGSIDLCWWSGDEFDEYDGGRHLVKAKKLVAMFQTGATLAANGFINLYNSVPWAAGYRHMRVGRWKLERGENPDSAWSPSAGIIPIGPGDAGGEQSVYLRSAQGGVMTHGHTMTQPTITRTTNVGISDHAATACTRATNVALSAHSITQPAFKHTYSGDAAAALSGSNPESLGNVVRRVNKGTETNWAATRTTNVAVANHTITQPAFNTPKFQHSITQPAFKAENGSVANTGYDASSPTGLMQPYLAVNFIIKW